MDSPHRGGRTPLQLWHAGIINYMGHGNTAVDPIFDNNDYYGINEEGPLTNNNVIIPVIATVNDTIAQAIQQQFDPLHDDGNLGIHLFSSSNTVHKSNFTEV